VQIRPIKWKMDSTLHEVTHGSPYMGRHPDRSLAGSLNLGRSVNWEQPFEDECQGCPGGWYRTRFIDSLDPYFRRRTGEGARVPNPRFDSADWIIQSAVMYFEGEQERLIAYRDYLADKHREKEAAKSEPQRPTSLRPGQKRR